MEKKTASPSIVKLALVLLAAAAVVALVLGVVNHVTKDRIAELAKEKTEIAYANVLEAENYEEVESYENNGTFGKITKLSKAIDESGALVGYVAETEFSGAQGMITMVVGVGADNSCTGIYVTKSSETAGLGALASETQEGAWRDNLAGTTIESARLAKDGGSIAAIAGATITSRACTNMTRYVLYVTSLLG